MEIWSSLKRSVAVATNAAQSMMGLKLPHEEFAHLSQLVIAWIDKEAHLPLSDAEPGLNALKRSKVKEHVGRIVELLKADAQEVKANSAALLINSPRSAQSVEVESSAGSVVDALLQTRFIEQLCHRAIRDRPVGAMSMLLQCVARIIEEVDYPLLPHISIRNTLADVLPRAVTYGAQNTTQLPAQIFEQTHERVNMNLVALLSAMWRRIDEDRNQIDFFLQTTVENGDPSVAKQLFPPEALAAPDAAAADGSEATTTRHPRYKRDLRIQPPGVAGARVDILTPLVEHALKNTELGESAREALLLAVSLKETIVCDFLASRTTLAPDLADAMAAAYRALPTSLDAQKVKPRGMLSMLAKFANHMTLLAHEVTVVERTASPRRLPVRGEVDCVGFASLVVHAVMERFVHPVLIPALVEPSEDQSLTACRYTSAILQAMASVGRHAPMLEAFAHVLLSDSNPQVQAKMVGSINSPSTRVATESCSLVARAIELASTDVVVQSMIVTEPQDTDELKGDEGDQASATSSSEFLGLANQELFQSKFEGIDFHSGGALQLENMAIRAIARQCSAHATRPRFHGRSQQRFQPSSLLNALLVRSRAFANVGVEGQHALLALYPRLLGHICAAQILPTASENERRASDTLLAVLFGTTYSRRYDSNTTHEPQAAQLVAVEIASKVWRDIFSHVSTMPAWQEKLELARRAWRAGLSSLDAGTGIEANTQVVLFTCCMLEEWILELHAYLVACDMLYCEASLLGELHAQQDVWPSPPRIRGGSRGVGNGISDDRADMDSIAGDSDALEEFDTALDLDGSVLDAEVNQIFATLEELVHGSPVAS